MKDGHLKKIIVLNAVKKNGRSLILDIVRITGYSRCVVNDHMRKLTEAGLLSLSQEKMGGRKTNWYTATAPEKVMTLVKNTEYRSIYLPKPEERNPGKTRAVEPIRHVVGKRYRGQPIP